MNELLTDPALQQLLNQSILLWALVAARLGPIVQLVPYMGGKAVPQMVKVALTIALTVLIYPLVWSTDALSTLPSGALEITALLLKELLLGVMFGFVAALVFDAVRIAGQLIDNARGQTQAISFAPQTPERVSVTGNYLYQLAIVIFLSVGGHRLFITALVNSYAAIPPQQFPDMGDHLPGLTLGIVRLAADSITLGVLLAFPVIASLLLADMCLALINKAAPQVNVFFLGMPIKALAGVAVVLFTLQTFADRALDEAVEGISFINAFLESVEASREGQ